ncbi:disulfide isomerase/thiol-disulfide oxidase, partial [mine drainage metagenome]
MKKHDLFRYVVLAAIMALSVAGVASASAAPLTIAQANVAVAAASHGAAHVLKTFAGPDGLTGAVIEGPTGNRNVVWVTSNAKAVVVEGTLVGLQGQDYTKAAMYAQGVLTSPASAIIKLAAPAAHGIMFGSNPKAPVLTVLIDPNCIFCHLLHKELAKPLAEGKVRVRYVMVG